MLSSIILPSVVGWSSAKGIPPWPEARRPVQRRVGTYRTGAMQLFGYGLPRIPISRTSENSVNRKSNFGESPKGEVRRILLLGRWVNKGKKSEGPSVETKRPQV